MRHQLGQCPAYRAKGQVAGIDILTGDLQQPLGDRLHGDADNLPARTDVGPLQILLGELRASGLTQTRQQAEKDRAELERLLAQAGQEAAIVRSFPGLGPVLTATLLGEAGTALAERNAKRWSSWKRRGVFLI